MGGIRSLSDRRIQIPTVQVQGEKVEPTPTLLTLNHHRERLTPRGRQANDARERPEAVEQASGDSGPRVVLIIDENGAQRIINLTSLRSVTSTA